MLRLVFAILILLHSLIHIIGFVKAFQFAEVRQLTMPISKTMGFLWLIASLMLILVAILFLLKRDYWVILGIFSVTVSQFVIMMSWHDARFGSLPNVIILITAIIGYETWSYYRHYEEDVKTALQEQDYFQNTNLTEEDIQPLPEPVKKYLRYTESIGKPKVNRFAVNFKGKIRKNEESDWMPFTSEQNNFMGIPTRLFFMKAVMKNLPVAGYHCFKNGDAFMDIRLLSLIRVQYQEDESMDQAETVTFFNDMCCMAPATLIDTRISWQQIDTSMVKATFTNNGIVITADLIFNDAGELVNFKSADRYNAEAGRKLPWATPLGNYKEINGYKLATYAEAIYTYPDKELCYGTFEVSSVKYNQ